jgi:phage tail-like protein
MSNEYPPVAFYFRLSFNGPSGSVNTTFKEVSGITMEMRTEEITEGGENSFKHRVPTSVKYSNLVLKRGIATKDSPLVEWCANTLGGNLSEQIETRNIVVSLLDENGDPLKAWSFANAWPVKWSASDLNSMKNEVVIETLEFSYSYFEEINTENT